MAKPPAALVNAVQFNCDISDARHAGEYSLCIYLLKMREFCRWSQGLGFNVAMSSKDVGEWVDKREEDWDKLVDKNFRGIELDGCKFEPFDNLALNAALSPRGLVYSAGYGRFSKPYFFLGVLLRTEELNGYTVLVSGKEYARELMAPPAMALGRQIFIRRESLHRMLWEKFEEWRWKRQRNAMARAIDFYDFERDVDSALAQMTEHELETMILHEIGEVVAGELIGDRWHDMVMSVSRTTAEFLVRAVRDHLADCLSSLPALLDDEDRASLHFYFANLTPLRKELFPALSQAYEHWIDHDDLGHLKRTVRDGKDHWLNIAGEILHTHHRYGSQSAARIETLVEGSHF